MSVEESRVLIEPILSKKRAGGIRGHHIALVAVILVVAGLFLDDRLIPKENFDSIKRSLLAKIKFSLGATVEMAMPYAKRKFSPEFTVFPFWKDWT